VKNLTVAIAVVAAGPPAAGLISYKSRTVAALNSASAWSLRVAILVSLGGSGSILMRRNKT